MEPLTYDIVIPATRDEVWDAWTTNAGLAAWLCLRANVEPEIGGAYELFWNPDPAHPESDSTLGCSVLSVDAPRLLQFTWRGSDAVAEVMNVPGAPVTQVKVELLPRPAGTRLVLTHSGWGEGAGWERARSWFDGAWTAALERLVKALSPPRS